MWALVLFTIKGSMVYPDDPSENIVMIELPGKGLTWESPSMPMQ